MNREPNLDFEQWFERFSLEKRKDFIKKVLLSNNLTSVKESIFYRCMEQLRSRTYVDVQRIQIEDSRYNKGNIHYSENSSEQNIIYSSSEENSSYESVPVNEANNLNDTLNNNTMASVSSHPASMPKFSKKITDSSKTGNKRSSKKALRFSLRSNKENFSNKHMILKREKLKQKFKELFDDDLGTLDFYVSNNTSEDKSKHGESKVSISSKNKYTNDNHLGTLQLNSDATDSKSSGENLIVSKSTNVLNHLNTNQNYNTTSFSFLSASEITKRRRKNQKNKERRRRKKLMLANNIVNNAPSDKSPNGNMQVLHSKPVSLSNDVDKSKFSTKDLTIVSVCSINGDCTDLFKLVEINKPNDLNQSNSSVDLNMSFDEITDKNKADQVILPDISSNGHKTSNDENDVIFIDSFNCDKNKANLMKDKRSTDLNTTIIDVEMFENLNTSLKNKEVKNVETIKDINENVHSASKSNNMKSIIVAPLSDDKKELSDSLKVGNYPFKVVTSNSIQTLQEYSLNISKESPKLCTESEKVAERSNLRVPPVISEKNNSLNMSLTKDLNGILINTFDQHNKCSGTNSSKEGSILIKVLNNNTDLINICQNDLIEKPDEIYNKNNIEPMNILNYPDVVPLSEKSRPLITVRSPENINSKGISPEFFQRFKPLAKNNKHNINCFECELYFETVFICFAIDIFNDLVSSISIKDNIRLFESLNGIEKLKCRVSLLDDNELRKSRRTRLFNALRYISKKYNESILSILENITFKKKVLDLVKNFVKEKIMLCNIDHLHESLFNELLVIYRDAKNCCDSAFCSNEPTESLSIDYHGTSSLNKRKNITSQKSNKTKISTESPLTHLQQMGNNFNQSNHVIKDNHIASSKNSIPTNLKNSLPEINKYTQHLLPKTTIQQNISQPHQAENVPYLTVINQNLVSYNHSTNPISAINTVPAVSNISVNSVSSHLSMTYNNFNINPVYPNARVYQQNMLQFESSTIANNSHNNKISDIHSQISPVATINFNKNIQECVNYPFTRNIRTVENNSIHSPNLKNETQNGIESSKRSNDNHNKNISQRIPESSLEMQTNNINMNLNNIHNENEEPRNKYSKIIPLDKNKQTIFCNVPQNTDINQSFYINNDVENRIQNNLTQNEHLHGAMIISPVTSSNNLNFFSPSCSIISENIPETNSVSNLTEQYNNSIEISTIKQQTNINLISNSNKVLDKCGNKSNTDNNISFSTNGSSNNFDNIELNRSSNHNVVKCESNSNFYNKNYMTETHVSMEGKTGQDNSENKASNEYINERIIYCTICDSRAKIQCTKCKVSCYCSTECQKKHWTAGHMEVCLNLINNSGQ